MRRSTAPSLPLQLVFPAKVFSCGMGYKTLQIPTLHKIHRFCCKLVSFLMAVTNTLAQTYTLAYHGICTWVCKGFLVQVPGACIIKPNKLVCLCKSIKVTDNNKDTSLLRYKLVTTVKSFMIRAHRAKAAFLGFLAFGQLTLGQLSQRQIEASVVFQNKRHI